jgi:hypothetical protein
MSAKYTIEEHRHRYAAWAAAAASRRGFADNASIVSVLDSSSLRRSLVDSPRNWPKTATEYDKFHKREARGLIRKFKNAGYPNVTYGRVAKMIAIYVKTIVVMGVHHRSPMARVAHPPIDRILLQVLSRIPLANSLRKLCRKTAWTKLDEKRYFELISELRLSGPAEPAFWQLERHWNLAVS